MCDRTLGRTPSNVVSPDMVHKVDVEYHLKLAKSLVANRGASGHEKIRFVYTSGKIVERDQNKSLWYMQEARRSRVGYRSVHDLTFTDCVRV